MAAAATAGMNRARTMRWLVEHRARGVALEDEIGESVDDRHAAEYWRYRADAWQGSVAESLAAYRGLLEQFCEPIAPLPDGHAASWRGELVHELRELGQRLDRIIRILAS